MGLLDRFLEQRANPENPATSLSSPDTWLADALWGGLSATGLGGSSATGLAITPLSALTSTAVFAAVRLVSQTVGSLPLVYYERMTRGKERAVTQPLYELLHDAPNDQMSAVTFRETLQANMLLQGNGFAEIESNGRGLPVALWPLPADKVTVRRYNGEKIFIVTMPDGTSQTLAADKMLHIPGLGYDGLVGYSPIRLAREAVALTLAAEKFGASFFGNGTQPAGVLKHPKQLSDKAYERIKAGWENRHRGLSNAQRTAILEEGMEWQATGIHPDDAQFLETRKFQISEIARMIGVPPHLIADLDRSTNNNIETQGIEFVVYYIRPWLVRWEQAIRQQLIPRADRKTFFAEFLVDGLLRGDIKSRFEAYAVAKANGWMSANEIRESENLNLLDPNVGDRYLEPANMRPLGDAADLNPDPGKSDPGALRSAILREVHPVLEEALRRANRRAAQLLANTEKRGANVLTGHAEYCATAWAPACQLYGRLRSALDAASVIPGPTEQLITRFIAGAAQRAVDGYLIGEEPQAAALLDALETTLAGAAAAAPAA